jgi:DNA-binding transcriptional regulator YiaG
MTHSAWSLVETPTFLADVDLFWTEDERLEFFQWLANNPEVGRVIPGSGGCRKTRWSQRGTGKRGGVRVIYFIRPDAREIWLLLIYGKMTSRKTTRQSRREALGRKLLESVREMKTGEAARTTIARLNEVARARAKSGMSQDTFARALGISKRTLQDWERGRRAPTGAAHTLIRIANRHPHVVREALR